MELKIEHIPSCSIAYIRHIGAYGPGNVQAMERLKNWANANHLLNDASVILGIAQDDPQVANPEDCRYDACLMVAEDTRISDNSVSLGRIAGGKYAVFTIDHTAEAVGMAWRESFPALQRQGFQADRARPIIERYKVILVQNHQCELCIPVY